MYRTIAENYDCIFPYKPQQKKFILSQGTRRRTYCDIACATGSLAANLTQQFGEIAALDSCSEMISLAYKRAAPGIDFFRGNMLKLEEYFWDNHFDVISCFGNTLVHLDSEQTILNVLKQVKKILRCEGVFVGQIVNYDNILDNKLPGLPLIENSDISFSRVYHLNDTECRFDFETELTIKKSGEKVSNSINLLPIRKNKLERLLTDAGFNTINFYSDFTRSPYDPEKLHLVFEAKFIDPNAPQTDPHNRSAM